MINEFSRAELLLGEGIQKLKASKVAIFGVGGVGGHAAEAEALGEVNQADEGSRAARSAAFSCCAGWSVAPIWRDNVQQGRKSSLGELLRERKVTGRDASLPAPC